jgi:hypothetical protein
MEINFIITCYDKEEYWPYLDKILKSYKKIKANYVVVYTGNKPEFNPNVRIPNRGHSRGDYDCIVNGYKYLKEKTNCNRWIKIGVDSWLLNEDVLISKFNEMERNACGYAGVWWNDARDDISTDIFLADTSVGNIFEHMLKHDVPDHLTPRFEVYMKQILEEYGIKCLILMERHPCWADYRWKCPSLGWTMSHKLQDNLDFLKLHASSD